MKIYYYSISLLLLRLNQIARDTRNAHSVRDRNRIRQIRTCII